MNYSELQAVLAGVVIKMIVAGVTEIALVVEVVVAVMIEIATEAMTMIEVARDLDEPQIGHHKNPSELKETNLEIDLKDQVHQKVPKPTIKP